jgi:hypothetical protein
VETPCHSIARPNKIMAGTRITLLQKPPAGFDFTIRTPGTPPRWVDPPPPSFLPFPRPHSLP